jgi:D-beta-D-heptose 7-phosphate kinase/D-beta-D-heptose 1-phosphate adenosyltransferase
MTDISEISRLIGQMEGACILCVGDLMLDRFVVGAVDRVSPEAPIPVLEVRDENVMIGGAGNVVRNVVAFGAAATLVAVVGDDPAGAEISALLEATPGADARLLPVKGRRTTIKTRFMTGGQQLLRADYEAEGPLSAADRSELYKLASEALADCGALILSDYGKGVLHPELIRDLIELARKTGKPVIVDPKGVDYGLYRGATLLTPNRKELREASGLPVDSDEAVVGASRHIMANCGIDGVLATRSEQGMTLVQREAVDHLPARARAVFDVSGAGDTVAAAIATGLALGATAPVAARFANTAAGVAVGKVGTAAAYASEIIASLHEAEFVTGEAKIATLASARDRVEGWRRQGSRVGFTNGCFDLLHPGHISLLNQARGACDVLIVGLNSDESVRGLKGANRPAQSESGRASVLASLTSVDMVVIFSEETPLEIINALKPEVLVKGQDYSLDEVVGAKEVQSWGGTVVLAEILDGHSTTETLRRMAP